MIPMLFGALIGGLIVGYFWDRDRVKLVAQRDAAIDEAEASRELWVSVIGAPAKVIQFPQRGVR